MIPIWAISGLAAGAIGMLGGIKLTTMVEEAKLARKEASWSAERAQAAVLTAEWQGKARQFELKERDKERMWNDIARSIDSDGLKTAEKLKTAVARSDVAASGLSSTLVAVTAFAARASQACASTADARVSTAIAETTRLLTELYGECRSSGRTRELFADEATARGQRCENWADTLTFQK